MLAAGILIMEGAGMLLLITSMVAMFIKAFQFFFWEEERIIGILFFIVALFVAGLIVYITARYIFPIFGW